MYLVLQRSLGSAVFSPADNSGFDRPPNVRADSRVLPFGTVPAETSLSAPVPVAVPRAVKSPTLLENVVPMERGSSKDC